MKRERNPLPDGVVVGARLQCFCVCGKKRGVYTVYRVGAGRKEAWANKRDGWPRIIRSGDFQKWRTYYEVLGPARAALRAAGRLGGEK